MKKEEKLEELQSVAKLTAISAETASANIQKYLELHKDESAKRKMAMYDDMFEQTSKALDETVKVAQKNIELYLQLKGSQND